MEVNAQTPVGPHRPRMVVVTGGPGAGKTALLEVARRHLCHHVSVSPEAAGILLRGGFPRDEASPPQRRAVQRAIFHVQCELERLALEEQASEVVLCGAGTVDGAVFWPDDLESFWHETGVTRSAQLLRYDAVIHLMSPPAGRRDGDANPEGQEPAEQPAPIDLRLSQVWADHPRLSVVPWTEDFFSKLSLALALIQDLLPETCRNHRMASRLDHLGRSTAARRAD